MKISVRSLLSVLTAVGIAAAGAANSAEAWHVDDFVIQSSNSNIVAWSSAGQFVQSPGTNTNFNFWMGAGDYRPNITPGRDSLYVCALGGANGGTAVPRPGWTCASSIFAGATPLNVTFPSFGSPSAPGTTVYTPDSTGSTPTFARIGNTTRFRVECN